jgi:Ca2+-binding RTX toxin-like protein
MTSVKFNGTAALDAFSDFNLTIATFGYNGLSSGNFLFEKTFSGVGYQLFTLPGLTTANNSLVPETSLNNKFIVELIGDATNLTLQLKNINVFSNQANDIDDGRIVNLWNYVLAGDDRISLGGVLASTDPANPSLDFGNARGAAFGDFAGTSVQGVEITRVCGDDAIVFADTTASAAVGGRITVSGDVFNVGNAGGVLGPGDTPTAGDARCGDDVIDGRQVGVGARLELYGDAVRLWNGSEDSTIFGDDVLRGGAAGDELYGDAGSTGLEAGGNDFLFGGAGVDLLFGGGGNDFLDGGAGEDTMEGGHGNDVFVVREANDVLGDLSGNDLVRSFINTYTLGSGLERAVAFTGSITLNGNALSNSLVGNGANNVLRGNGGNDTIDGGDGNDLISGGEGIDTLTGGNGVDGFVFNLAPNFATNRDLIVDFEAADDTIRLDDAAFVGIGPVGALAATAFKTIGVPGGVVDANDRIIFNKATGSLTFDANGSAAGGATVFAFVGVGLTLTAADFFVF